MKKVKFIALLATVILIASYSLCGAFEMGGVLESTLVGTMDASCNVSPDLWNKAGLEFIFPPREKTSARFDVDVYGSRGGSEFFIRSLYIRRRFQKLHLTLGRQPISWNFGSLVNPVDFSLGAEIAGEERTVKFHDAAEIYVPLGWNAGLSAVGALSSDTDEVKGGLRMRCGVAGFDLAVNFIREPAGILPSRNEIFNRIGVSAKGDLGPMGFYGAFGGIWDDKLSKAPELTSLAGVDYSFTHFGYRRVYMQFEYLGLSKTIKGELLGPENTSGERNTNLFAANITYGLDEFSSLGITGFVLMDSEDVVLSPYIESNLGDNTLLTIRGGWLSGDNVPIFGQAVFEDEIKAVKAIVQTSLSYSF